MPILSSFLFFFFFLVLRIIGLSTPLVQNDRQRSGRDDSGIVDCMKVASLCNDADVVYVDGAVSLSQPMISLFSLIGALITCVDPLIPSLQYDRVGEPMEASLKTFVERMGIPQSQFSASNYQNQKTHLSAGQRANAVSNQ